MCHPVRGEKNNSAPAAEVALRAGRGLFHGAARFKGGVSLPRLCQHADETRKHGVDAKARLFKASTASSTYIFSGCHCQTGRAVISGGAAAVDGWSGNDTKPQYDDTAVTSVRSLRPRPSR